MKKGKLLVMCLVIMLLASPLFAQDVSGTTNYQSVILEGFDSFEERQWVACGSKFINDEYVVGSGAAGCESVVRSQLVDAWPEALYRQPPEGEAARSLGINAAFNRKGYNYLEIIPAQENQDGDLVASPVQIPGNVRNLDLWVWGSNRNYYMELHLRDYRGISHTVDLGDIDFRGWHNLRVSIPSSIPQEVVYVPQRQGLELTKLVLWTRPAERTDEFFVYLDQLKVFTDMFEEPFDGERLADPEYVQQLWSQGQQEEEQ
jgi:hypothetical protein